MIKIALVFPTLAYNPCNKQVLLNKEVYQKSRGQRGSSLLDVCNKYCTNIVYTC